MSDSSAADNSLVPWLLVSRGLLPAGVELCSRCFQRAERLLGVTREVAP